MIPRQLGTHGIQSSSHMEHSTCKTFIGDPATPKDINYTTAVSTRNSLHMPDTRVFVVTHMPDTRAWIWQPKEVDTLLRRSLQGSLLAGHAWCQHSAIEPWLNKCKPSSPPFCSILSPSTLLAFKPCL